MQEALAAAPATKVVEQLLQSLKPETEMAERLTMLAPLAWTESHAGFEAMLDVLAGLDAMQLRSRSVRAALDRELLPMLAADSRRFRLLEKRLAKLPMGLVALLTSAAAELQRPETLGVFQSAARLSPSLERQVLEELSRRAYPALHQDRVQLILLARGQLASRDVALRRTCVAALGNLGDVESFLDLARLLDDPDRSTQRAALAALQQLSGLQRAWQQPQWLAWFEAEKAWLESVPELRSELRSDDLYQAKAATRELAAHPLFAEQAVEQFKLCMTHPDAGIRQLACEGLASLKHPDATQPLIDALRDREQAVRDSALGGLQRVTGMDLGQQQHAWQQWWRSL